MGRGRPRPALVEGVATRVLRDWLERRAGGPARLYERVIARIDGGGVAAARRALLAEVAGPVLEIGSGPGTSFRYYPAGVAVTALEPEPDFRRAAAERASSAAPPIRVVAGDAHDLPFADASFATVVAQLTLCSVASPAGVLSEARRVLVAGGGLRLLEHVRHPAAWVGRVQDVLDPLWNRLEGRGCHLGRDTPRAVAEAGFVIDGIDEVPLPAGSAWLFPLVMLRARRPA